MFLYPNALAWQANALAELGDFPVGIARGREAVRLHEAGEDPFGIATACMHLGRLYLIRGDVEQAVRELQRGRDVAEAANFPLVLTQIRSSLGRAYTFEGRLGEGLPLLEEAERTATAMRYRFDQSLRLVWLGEAYLRDGRPAEAVSAVGRALDDAHARGERGNEAWALRLLAEIAARADALNVAAAEARYHQALALADELGMRPLAAHCHLGLGTLYQKIGRDEQAQVELTTAAEIYGAMGMTFWLGRARAELAEVAP
jgi:tetratricopeptide (TPR) repeat protein